MPGSPEINTTQLSPAFACSQRRISSSISSSRPTSGVVAVRIASKRPSTELARSAAQDRAGPVMPFRSFAPRSSSSNRLPRSFRVPSAITIRIPPCLPPCRWRSRRRFLSTQESLLLSSKFLSSRRARHACAEIDRFGDKCGEWVEFRLALRNPISFDEQRLRNSQHCSGTARTGRSPVWD
jgi:hypothetical protein